MVLRVVVIILASYFLRNLNGAILISRLLAHDDVRRHGSGNAGFTNFCRNYGSLSGLLVFAIDALKAVAACLLGRVLLAPVPCLWASAMTSLPPWASTAERASCAALPAP